MTYILFYDLAILFPWKPTSSDQVMAQLAVKICSYIPFLMKLWLESIRMALNSTGMVNTIM